MSRRRETVVGMFVEARSSCLASARRLGIAKMNVELTMPRVSANYTDNPYSCKAIRGPSKPTLFLINALIRVPKVSLMTSFYEHASNPYAFFFFFSFLQGSLQFVYHLVRDEVNCLEQRLHSQRDNYLDE